MLPFSMEHAVESLNLFYNNSAHYRGFERRTFASPNHAFVEWLVQNNFVVMSQFYNFTLEGLNPVATFILFAYRIAWHLCPTQFFLL